MADLLPDGVYIGLPDHVYFKQGALGSSDLKYLWDETTADGWWWRSPHNPYYQQPKKDHLAFGSALHCLALEGEEAYAARYHVMPSKSQFKDLIETTDDLKSALKATDCPPAVLRSKKSELVEAAKTYCPGRHIWDDIYAKAERKAAGKLIITAEIDHQVRVMVEAGMKNPFARALFTAEGGVRVTELSVFWTLSTGTRLRFRFDSLLPVANCDLKSIDGWRSGESLTDAAGQAIGRYHMDIQAALSFTARRMMYHFINAGQVHIWPEQAPGATDPEIVKAWLKRFPTEAPLDAGDAPGWSWCWLFFQKPTNDGRAPALLPVFMRFGSLEHVDGYNKAVLGIQNYEARVAKFGLEQPWAVAMDAHYLDAAAPASNVQIPSWIPRPPAVSGTEKEMDWKAK